MSEASAHKMAYVVETTRGTTPTNPRFRYLPDTRTTLALSKDTLATERLTGTRFPAEPRHGASTVGGEIPVDLSSQTYDDFISSALQGAWVDDAGAGADTVDLTEDGTAALLSEVTDTFTTTSGTVTIESIDAKAQEVVFTYVEGTDPPITYEIFGLGTVTIDSVVFVATGYTDALQSATAVAGDTRKSFSILREFSDFDGGLPFLLFAGCEVSAWNLSAAANGLAKSSFTLFGRTQTGPSAAAPANTTYAPALDAEPFDTFSGSMEIDGTAECIVTDYNLTIENGHAAKYTVGCTGSQDPMVGQSLVSGSITAYFEDATLLTKFVNDSALALKLTLTDSDGDKLIIDLPNLSIGSGTQADVTGDGSITIPVNFTAHKDDTLGSHISVQRVRPV
mgnify:CR=1 FL=1|tara:strand:+ start:1446 stop:2627 length:1182 start_codon:yes stop_codon:yes gene_type:complete